MLLTSSVVLVFSVAYGFLCIYTGSFVPFGIIFEKNVPERSSKLVPPNPTTPQPPSRSILHHFEKAAVCSDSMVCSEIGSKTLQKGGSAVDAAISTLLCNGLITMQSMGLGGGMLMNIYSRKEKKSYSVLSRETAPLAVSPIHLSTFKKSIDLAQSSLSIAVPTEVMGYAVAHDKFGKLSWSELVKPTIEICNLGFILTKHQRDSLESNRNMLTKNNLLRKMFVNITTHRLFRIGSKVKPPVELCRTYETLAKYGPRTFYNGELALNISEDLKEMGSLVQLNDLTTLKVEIANSVMQPLGNSIIHFMPPPSSGYILQLVLQIIAIFDDITEQSKEVDALVVHRIVEALKFAFVRRWKLDVGAEKEFLTNLTCPKHAANIAGLIDNNRTYNDPVHYGADSKLLNLTDQGTAHISVIAPNGDAVSVTSSINFYFGSGQTGSRTAILFNNALSDFNIEGLSNYFGLPNVKHTNQVFPNRSPMSSMSPVILTDTKGDVILVVGAAGGTKIISALAYILVRIVWMGDNIKEAIDAARFHHQLLPNVLEYEYGIQQQLINKLEERGHRTERYRERGSAVCGIQRNKNTLIVANADYRKEGGIAGF